MLSRIKDKNIWLIYGATILLGIAYGLSVALIALHLDAVGFTKTQIGTLAGSFASGLIVMSIPAGWLIRKVSAKGTLATSLAGYAIAVALFPTLTSYSSIAIARFFDGGFSVCIWVSCETILLSRAGKHNKAFVTSLYAIAVAVGYVLGPLTAYRIVAIAPMRVGFFTSGAIALAAAALVLARLDRDPTEREIAAKEAEESASDSLDSTAPPDLEHEGSGKYEGRGEPLSTIALLVRIRTSCFGTFAYGYFQASVVLFLPLYLTGSRGVSTEQTILVPAFFAGGMLLFSNVAGRLGDRYGHLLVMRVLAAIGMTMVLGFVFLPSFPLMCVAVFVAGATLASISPVSLALQGVVTPPRDYSRSNGIYNAFYASGILLGPLVSSVLCDRWGGAAMLYHLTGLWGAFVLFSIVYAADDPAARRRAGRAIDDAADTGESLAQ